MVKIITDNEIIILRVDDPNEYPIIHLKKWAISSSLQKTTFSVVIIVYLTFDAVVAPLFLQH